MPVEVFASELDLGLATGAHVALDPSWDGLGLRCGCPMCSGQAVTLDAVVAAQAFLNADERSGASPNGKPSLTVDQAGKWLTESAETRVMSDIRGDGGWAPMGQAAAVTYGFRASDPSYAPDDAGGFGRFTSQQITLAEQALQGWSDVANITFRRIGSGTSGEGAYTDNATILLGNYTTGVNGASAFAYFPGSTTASARAGDVWINSSIGYNANPVAGAYGNQVLLHEIGHAMGLAHPGNYNADGDTTFTYAQDAEYYEDSRQYTVMSYFNEANTGASYRGLYAAAPQLDDIAAAQVEYGANMTTRTGDTVYGFNATADRPWFSAASSFSKMVFAVWDAGGNDTFDFSGYSDNQVIDLREGFFSSAGSLIGNVAIAANTVIENAIGGSGSDRIIGNSAANGLFGSLGADTLMGGAGNDSISGGDGIGFLRGEDGNDSLIGGAQFDDMHGNAGNDTLRGGGDGDWVVGGKDDDLLFGDAGGDVVLGNLGADTLEGGDDDDVVRGGQGDDAVRGGAGSDWISGDRGADTLTGGAGADIFHTFDGAGVDRVTDFNAGEGDRVFLLAGTQYSVAQTGADTVITVTGTEGGQLVLAGVQMSSLGSGWIFGA